MTTTDLSNYRSSIDPLVEAVGLVPLSTALDRGDLSSVTDESIENYAKVAAVRWKGANLVMEGRPQPYDDLRDAFGSMLLDAAFVVARLRSLRVLCPHCGVLGSDAKRTVAHIAEIRNVIMLWAGITLTIMVLTVFALLFGDF